MRFLVGPPVFAVEVRSEYDYGEAADTARAAKRSDYFEAGTLVVWDVDAIADQVLKYLFDAPDQPVVFIRGQVADAEPAVPNWKMVVDAIFG
jgi:Uma2 family endonuclease